MRYKKYRLYFDERVEDTVTNKKNETKLKRKRFLIAFTIISLLILLIPSPLGLHDGGTVKYRAMIYTVTNYRRFWNEDGYYGFLVGIRIDVFNRTVFDNVRFERP